MPNFRFSALRRPRLYPDRGVQRAALTLVLAPAGYGKSTLVAQWINEGLLEPLEVHWVWCRPEPLAEGSRDSVSAAVQSQLWLSICDALNVDTSVNPHDSVIRAVDRLVEPTMIVLDDYHNVTDPHVDMELLTLLRAESNLFITVISRYVSLLDGPLISSQTTVSLIGADDLVFTGQEIAELAAHHGLPSAAATQVEATVTHGWPLAVSAAMLGAQQGMGRQEVAGQFAQLVRQQASLIENPLATKILHQVVVCERISMRRLGAFTGRSAADILEALQELESLGLISYRTYPGGRRYSSRFPELAFLASDADYALGKEVIAELKRGHLLELAEDDADTAMAELIELRELKAAEQVLLSHFISVMTPSRRFTEAVRRVPRKEIGAHPLLNAVLLLIEMADPRTPPATLDRLHLQVRQSALKDLDSGTPEGTIVSLAALVMAQRMRGSGAETLKFAGELERRLENAQERDLERVRPSLSVLYAVAAFAGVINGSGQLGERAFLRAYEAALAAQNESEQIRGLSGMALVAAMSGHVEEARSLNERAVDLILAAGIAGPPFSRVNRQTANALVAVDDRKPLELQAILDDLDPLLPTLEQAGILVYAQTQMTRMTEGPLEALKVLEHRVHEITGSRRIPPYLMTELVVLKANLLTYVGGYPAARILLDKVPKQMRVGTLSQARLALFEGDSAEGLRLAESMMGQGGSERFLNQGRVIAAVAAAELGQTEVSLGYLGDLGSSLLLSGGVNVLGSVPYEPLLKAVTSSLEAGGGNDPTLHHLLEEVHGLPRWLRAERFEALSQSEMRVLQLLDEDLSREEIAKRLFVSTNTVKFHLRGVYRKLGATNKWEALRRAAELELLETEEE